jgi:hypothetical protein
VRVCICPNAVAVHKVSKSPVSPRVGKKASVWQTKCLVVRLGLPISCFELWVLFLSVNFIFSTVFFSMCGNILINKLIQNVKMKLTISSFIYLHSKLVYLLNWMVMQTFLILSDFWLLNAIARLLLKPI